MSGLQVFSSHLGPQNLIKPYEDKRASSWEDLRDTIPPQHWPMPGIGAHGLYFLLAGSKFSAFLGVCSGFHLFVEALSPGVLGDWPGLPNCLSSWLQQNFCYWRKNFVPLRISHGEMGYHREWALGSWRWSSWMTTSGRYGSSGRFFLALRFKDSGITGANP